MSNRDMQNLSEKNIKILLLGILFQSNLYLPVSEMENSEGYTDIYLQKRTLYPANYEWVWELKYVKTADAENQTLIAAKQRESMEQLTRYKSSNLFKDKTDVRYLSIVFVGKKDCLIEEV
jgi:predicted nucleic acid-binding protein